MEDMWQRNATLSETNLCMLEDEILCDVTFLAGESRQAVKAHKYVLVSRSPVFYAMFCGTMTETSDQIPIPDIEADILKELLRYMYTVVANITPETVTSLMYAANKYDVTAFVTVCRDYLKSNSTPENVCTILEQAHVFDDKELIEQCQNVIEENTVAVLDSEAFLLSSSTCLRSILEMEVLKTSEDHIYTSCVKWAKQECTRRGKEQNDATCREVLGDLLYLIRFPCMSSDTFTKLTCDSRILTDEEKVDVFQYICSTGRKCVRFNNVLRRKSTIISINRFDSVEDSTWNYESEVDFILFSCSSDAHLTGVGIYDNTECTLKILQDKSTLFVSEISGYESTSSGILDVMFEKTIRLKKNTLYEIVQDNREGTHRYGTDGKAIFSVDDFTVTFSSNPRTDRYSDVINGQIPRLYLRPVRKK